MNHDYPKTNGSLSSGKHLKDYLPLGVVVVFILICTWLLLWHTGFRLDNFLSYSMGFFFLFFAMFKLMDLAGFAHGYHEYDLIAQRFMAWGYVYPFVEAALGILYLMGNASPALLLFTLVLTAVNCAGIAIKMAKHEVVQCACLGTVLKVPLTHVSLIEYASMGVMALVMFLI